MSPLLTRRTVLRGGLTLSAVAAVAVTAGCDRAPSPEEVLATSLVPLADAAYADAADATALSARITDYATALRTVGEQRTAHAERLREEITRLDQDIAAQISRTGAAGSTNDSATSAPAGAVPDTQAMTIDDYRAQLTESARAASDLCPTLSGYAAGLTGAVAASVTSMVKVALA